MVRGLDQEIREVVQSPSVPDSTPEHLLLPIIIISMKGEDNSAEIWKHVSSWAQEEMQATARLQSI